MTHRVVIAGAGHAAGQLVASLKQHKFPGQIVLVGDEAYLPYQRPPLSKKFLSGDLSSERLYVKPQQFYDDPQIEIRRETRVTDINRSAKTLTVGDGETIVYDKLVLALGARVRELRIGGAHLKGIHYLRSIADVESIRAELGARRKAVIIGAGYIGLEVAAVLRHLGVAVTVVEMADRVMSRVVSTAVSDFFQIEHTNQGVHLRLSTGISAFRGDVRVTSVETSDGEQIAADFVIVGVGVIANTELAAAAGLAVDDGIVVDDRCLSSDASVFSIGDCTSQPNPVYGRQLRLESVQNALQQARVAAANICGKNVSCSEVPWFWSDQYDLKLQIAGLSDGYDDVLIRGNPAERQFACLYLRDGRLIATDAINSPRDFLQSKSLIARQVQVDKDRLADVNVPLKDF